MSENPYQSPREDTDPSLPPPPPPSKLLGVGAAFCGLMMLVMMGLAGVHREPLLDLLIALAVVGPVSLGLVIFGLARLLEHETGERIGGWMVALGLGLLVLAILGSALSFGW